MSEGRKPLPKTPAERQQALRDARRAAGLVRVCIYAHPADHAAIKAAAAKLEARRKRAKEKT